MKYFYSTLLLLCFSFHGVAQNDLSVGLRFGPHTSFSITSPLSSTTSVEGIVLLNHRGVIATGLFEHNRSLFDDGQEWQYFYGYGGHIGFWRSEEPSLFLFRQQNIGFDGIFGIRYVMENLPFEFTLDCKPSINLLRNGAPGTGGFALSARYIL